MINIYCFPITSGLICTMQKLPNKQKQMYASDISIHYSKAALQTNNYKDPVATFTDSLYFRVLKNISDYIPPNEKTDEACTVKECKMLNLVVFTFLPRETE